MCFDSWKSKKSGKIQMEITAVFFYLFDFKMKIFPIFGHFQYHIGLEMGLGFLKSNARNL